MIFLASLSLEPLQRTSYSGNVGDHTTQRSWPHDPNGLSGSYAIDSPGHSKRPTQKGCFADPPPGFARLLGNWYRLLKLGSLYDRPRDEIGSINLLARSQAARQPKSSRKHAMNSHEMSAAASAFTGHFPEPLSTRCPECHSRLCLQLLVAELLFKNHKLRMELLEARSLLARNG